VSTVESEEIVMQTSRGLSILVAAVVIGCGGGDEAPPCPCADVKDDTNVTKDPGMSPDVPPDPGATDEKAPDLTDVAKEIGEGQFGAPCLSNTDCESGFCVEGVEGFVCTMPCLEECPQGWVCRGILVGPDMVSLCIPLGANLCKTCKMDTQCGDGLCLEIGDGLFCGRDCESMDCPSGYLCEDVETDDGTYRQCLPVSGACDCNVTSHGFEKPCVKENQFGTCLGWETCDKDQGWVDCTALEPSVEDCNGVDDDCNGVADDDPEPPAETCENDTPGIGSCPGEWVCAGESGWGCIGPHAKAEECNYIDDDCDGETDEDYKNKEGKYTDLGHCGMCGNFCEGKIPFADTVICDDSKETPSCVVTDCVEGYYVAGEILCLAKISNLCIPCAEDANCGALGDKCLDMGSGMFCGRDCTPGSVFGQECPEGYSCNDLGEGVEQCVPVSGSCDCTPGNAGMHRVCTIENEFGTCSGTETCDPALGWVNCTAKAPGPEFCNGLDDDCNGYVDDELDPPPEPCANQWTDPVSGDTYTCSADWECAEGGEGTTWVCNADEPGPELCNYLDDNCNGLVDEDYKVPDTNKYGAFDHCGACGVSCEDLIPNGSEKCDTTDPQPTCVVDECDAGFWKASELSCVEFPQTLCMPCAADGACQVPGDTCEEAASGGLTFCLWDCSAGSLHPELSPEQKTCPEGYYCRETDDLGDPFFKCMPTSNACDCLDSDDGEARLCEQTNSHGTCIGQETCDPDLGWVGCSALEPKEETCNGVDDDCNGITDEQFPELLAVCFEGVGECREAGVMVCNDTEDGVECDAVPDTPAVEECDGLDNDCMGDVDEDWPGKGKACSEGVGECLNNGVQVCRADGSGLECDAVPGAPAVEECDGLDNDCMGDVDEDWPGKGAVCLAGVGECQSAGTNVCKADGSGIECNAVPGAPAVEECDGLDNDCMGDVDEDWPGKGAVCLAGVGECQSAGTNVCKADGSGIECNAVPGTGSAETCDLLDNNCDGQTDEPFKVGGEYAMDTACGNCFTDCTQIYALPHAFGTCDSAGTPTCVMNCQTQYYDMNDIPDDGCEFMLDADAIYVSVDDPDASDIGNCGLGPVGTLQNAYPCESINEGLDRATATGRSKVLVADGLYEETVTLQDGRSILGGYRSDTWERHADSSLSTIRGEGAGLHSRTIVADGITSTTILEGFIIYGPVNTQAGGNSYALWIRNCTSALSISDNSIYAGTGGPGTNGAHGNNGGKGMNGSAGSAAKQVSANCFDECNSGMETSGGNGGSWNCSGTNVSGGDGGRAVCPNFQESVDLCSNCLSAEEQTITPASNGEQGDNGGGAGGSGGYDALIDGGCLGSCSCIVPNGEQDGANGSDGQDGNSGNGGSGCSTPAGTVSGSEWIGNGGGNGSTGNHGSGGGGGGAGGGVETYYNASCSEHGTTDIGGSGGGGGSGGCRGTGGAGGNPGGGAFDVFLIWSGSPSSAPVIESNTLTRGFGGNGGQGGNGGTGGPGGSGKNGGASGAGPTATFCAPAGGKGGEGGDGGHGGGGGGSCGGASYGFFAWGQGGLTLGAYKTSNTFLTGGFGGQGGASGGSMGSIGSAGNDGASSDYNF